MKKLSEDLREWFLWREGTPTLGFHKLVQRVEALEDRAEQLQALYIDAHGAICRQHGRPLHSREQIEAAGLTDEDFADE